jgi:putative transposase
VKRKRVWVEQITGILQQAELDTPIADLCRQHGAEQSYYRRKKNSDGMEPSEARELKQLREEREAKRLVADVSLE